MEKGNKVYEFFECAFVYVAVIATLVVGFVLTCFDDPGKGAASYTLDDELMKDNES